VLETAARTLGGDTTLAVRAEVTPEDPSGVGVVVVVVTGRYSVPSAHIRNARVLQRPGSETRSTRGCAPWPTARVGRSRLRLNVALQLPGMRVKFRRPSPASNATACARSRPRS
jgi:hypothetical protein